MGLYIVRIGDVVTTHVSDIQVSVTPTREGGYTDYVYLNHEGYDYGHVPKEMLINLSVKIELFFDIDIEEWFNLKKILYDVFRQNIEIEMSWRYLLGPLNTLTFAMTKYEVPIDRNLVCVLQGRIVSGKTLILKV